MAGTWVHYTAENIHDSLLNFHKAEVFLTDARSELFIIAVLVS